MGRSAPPASSFKLLPVYDYGLSAIVSPKHSCVHRFSIVHLGTAAAPFFSCLKRLQVLSDFVESLAGDLTIFEGVVETRFIAVLRQMESEL